VPGQPLVEAPRVEASKTLRSKTPKASRMGKEWEEFSLPSRPAVCRVNRPSEISLGRKSKGDIFTCELAKTLL